MIAALLVRGECWDAGRSLAGQVSFSEHVGFVTGLRERGVIIEVGPLVDLDALGAEDPLGLALLNVDSVEAALSEFAADPMVQARILAVRARAWGGEPLSRAG